MSDIVYIKTPQCVEVKKNNVSLKDFLTIYCTNSSLKENIDSLPFYTFKKNENGQLVVSILNVIKIITKHFPEAEIENLGEEDFILAYRPACKWEKAREIFFTTFICLTAFFGGGYAIMAYNTDVGAKELFANLSMLYLGNAKTGTAWVTIAYSIGLAIGMILFFNHLGTKKLDEDPTPLEIQMRLYEKDISTTIIKDMSRRGESMDINE